MNHPLQCRCGTLKGHVVRPGMAQRAMLGIIKSVVGARLGGGYKHNPFFDTETGTPVRPPRELTRAERERATPA